MQIGQSIPRREGRAKVSGRARYLDDLSMPGMLYGVTVRSPVPRGILRDIEYSPDILGTRSPSSLPPTFQGGTSLH